jgi:hypothetical protein
VGKGWVFYWEGCYFYVGAPDAPTARQHLRKQHLRVAQHARFPRELTDDVAQELGLQDGDIMVGGVGG